MLWFLEYWKEILFTVVALRGAYAFYRDMMNKATTAQMPTSVIAPPTLLDEICRECLVNVPADRMEKARVVVAEYEVQIAPKSGKKFHFDEQCHAIGQAIKVQRISMKLACKTLTPCSVCKRNLKQLVREHVIRCGFVGTAVD